MKYQDIIDWANAHGHLEVADALTDMNAQVIRLEHKCADCAPVAVTENAAPKKSNGIVAKVKDALKGKPSK